MKSQLNAIRFAKLLKIRYSRNERLHIDINSHMKMNKYGVELTHALITTVLFENIRAKCEDRCAAAIDTVNRNRVCEHITSEQGTQNKVVNKVTVSSKMS